MRLEYGPRQTDHDWDTRPDALPSIPPAVLFHRFDFQTADRRRIAKCQNAGVPVVKIPMETTYQALKTVAATRDYGVTAAEVAEQIEFCDSAVTSVHLRHQAKHGLVRVMETTQARLFTYYPAELWNDAIRPWKTRFYSEIQQEIYNVLTDHGGLLTASHIRRILNRRHWNASSVARALYSLEKMDAVRSKPKSGSTHLVWCVWP